MAEERFLVTGALGCIGAWILRTLLREGIPAAGFDLGTDTRAARAGPGAGRARPRRAGPGRRHRPGGGRARARRAREHARHPPRGDADPARQGRPAARRARQRRRHRERLRGGTAPAGAVRGLAYASSAAVYGPDAPARVAEDAPTRARRRTTASTSRPNEGAARVYWADDGVPSVGLRPYVVYGAGRDQGLTAGPDPRHGGGRARRAVPHRLRRPRADALRARRGAGVHRRRPPLGGGRRPRRQPRRARRPAIDEVVAAIEAAAPEAAGTITFDETPAPVPGGVRGRRPPRAGHAAPRGRRARPWRSSVSGSELYTAAVADVLDALGLRPADAAARDRAAPARDAPRGARLRRRGPTARRGRLRGVDPPHPRDARRRPRRGAFPSTRPTTTRRPSSASCRRPRCRRRAAPASSSTAAAATSPSSRRPASPCSAATRPRRTPFPRWECRRLGPHA